MTAETVSKPHYEDGQMVHYHMHKWAEDGKGGYDFTLVPVPFTLNAAHDYAVILDHGDPDAVDCTDPANCVNDIAQNRDTAHVMVNSGKVAVALNPENQAALDYERALYVDCFGE